jgi:hypothetical protein
VWSVTKSFIGALTAIAWKDGLLDSPSHRVLEFFDPGSIANLDDRKEAITVQNLLDMTSGNGIVGRWYFWCQSWDLPIIETILRPQGKAGSNRPQPVGFP